MAPRQGLSNESPQSLRIALEVEEIRTSDSRSSKSNIDATSSTGIWVSIRCLLGQVTALALMSRQYIPLPNPLHGDPDHELEEAFAGSDDEDENDNRNVNRPLLSSSTRSQQVVEATRTPITSSHQPTVDGRYNFDYDFPPAGNPPTHFAAENHWGNTNGQVPTFPSDITPNSSQQGWLSRGWKLVKALRRPSPSGRLVGGGMENDGVFGNVSARPTLSRPAPPVPSGQSDTIFHAPETEQDEAPPVCLYEIKYPSFFF